ncbi:hypothetical protein [Okeania sp. KiyG1]|uniref:hypothetical protein n=1 Tax=Okeania sp. KiyG1 TaxID=2720165 RepID=UPI00192187DE|nr:hypothetical protein CYANOKiyG1_68420 [Okeania sp. KiyG1]
MLSYKAKMVGIDVIITEESYTSASSFIDNDLIPVYNKSEKNQVTFSGKRIKRCSAAKGVFPHERLHQDKEECNCTASIGLINELRQRFSKHNEKSSSLMSLTMG